MTAQLTMTIPPRAIGGIQAEACLEKTRQTQDDWPERAWEALLVFVMGYKNGQSWTGEAATEYIVAVCGEPHDNRATGSLLARLKRQGLAIQTDEFYRREHGNGTFARKWRTV
jgi:FPC/CPF motif-containing protein YcgG